MKRSLPPKILGDVVGRLDFLILRPALLPPLLSTQALDFIFKWWGDDQICCAKLNPQCDEVKFIFDICCDSLGFQRYLEDSEKVDVKIIVSADGMGNFQTKEIKGGNHYYKNKKHWINGEIVGNFLIHNLKLNSRGELVSECKIINKFGDVCGSVIVFMLYTPKLINGIESLDEKEVQLVSSTKAMKSLPISSHFHSHQTENIEKDKHSLDSRKPTLVKVSPENCSEDYLKKNCKQASELSYQELEENYISDVDLLEYLPDRSFLIKRLFSFVDSGAIQLADLPTLLEICEGRSPSLDFDVDQSNIKLSPVRDNKIVPEKTSPQNVQQLDDLKNIPKLSDSSNYESLLIVYINVINLNTFDEDVNKLPKPEFKKRNNFGTKKMVRQRSKICFLLQISVHCERENEPVTNKNSALFVSRQVENGIVIYNSSEILQLPSNSNIHKLDGYLKARVIRRKLGERLGTEVGVGIIPLQKLYEIREKEALLSLLHPSFKDRKTQQLTGSLCFKVIFALVNESQSKSVIKQSPVLNENELSFNSSSHCGYKHSVSNACAPNSSSKSLLLSAQHNNKKKTDHETRRQNLLLPAYSMQNNKYDDDSCTYQCATSSNEFEKSVELSPHKIQCNLRNANKQENMFPKNNSFEVTEIPITKPFDIEFVNKLKDNRNTKRNLFCDKSSSNRQYDLKSNSPSQPCSPSSINRNSQSENQEYDNYHDTSMKKSPLKDEQDIHSPHPVSSSNKRYDSSPVIYADVSAQQLQKDVTGFTECNVLLEIFEGRNFPRLITAQSDVSFAPNAYVKVFPPIIDCNTNIVLNSVTPNWNFKTNIMLSSEDLPSNQEYLLLLVFHCLSGDVPSSNDPLLGFAALDIHLLWTNFLFFSGWVPLINRDGGTCGEIYMSLKEMETDKSCVESSTQTSLIWDIPHETQNSSGYPSPNMIRNMQTVCNTRKECDGCNCTVRFESQKPFQNKQQFYRNLTSDEYEEYLKRTAENSNRPKLGQKQDREIFYNCAGDKMLHVNSPPPDNSCENYLSNSEFINHMSQDFDNGSAYYEQSTVPLRPIVDGSTFIISPNCKSPAQEYQHSFENYVGKKSKSNFQSEEIDFQSRDKETGEYVLYTVPPLRGAFSPHEGVGSPHKGAVPPHKGAFSPHKGVYRTSKEAFSPRKGFASPRKGAVPPHNGKSYEPKSFDLYKYTSDTTQPKSAMEPFTWMNQLRSMDSHSAMEPFTWMSQLRSMDTPCASFDETVQYSARSPPSGSKDNSREILSPILEAEPFKRKVRKCRIAANINMPHFEVP